MTPTMAFVLVVIVFMMVSLMMEKMSPVMTVFVTLVILLMAGMITPEQALSGFANEGIATICLLFIISGAIRQSGFFERFIYAVMGHKNSGRLSLLRMMIPVSAISAFINNTPIVVALMPFVKKWCLEHGLAPSKFLIPLSYATILGGMVTLMGTSTNLVIHGLLLENKQKGFSMFELSIVGLPAVICGLFYLAWFGFRLLPARPLKQEGSDVPIRDYLAECVVEDHSPHNGKTVEDAGLRHLESVFLIEIIRGAERIYPVKHATTLCAGDRLIFTGDLTAIGDLQKTKGLKLEPFGNESFEVWAEEKQHVVEAVVSHRSQLVGQAVKDTHFRSRFDAAIIAIHRHGERIKGKIGDIVLKPGDTLLLLTGPDFTRHREFTDDFYLTTARPNPFLTRGKRRTFAWLLSVFIVLIIMVGMHWLSMFQAMCLETALLFLTKAVTAEDVKKYVPVDVLVLIGCSFGIGAALEQSGLAEYVALGLVHFAEPYGLLAIMAILYFATNVLTEFITNSAAAVIMFPISLSCAAHLHMAPDPFMVLLAVSASASFMTPIGYQTNLIVYGPGGYRFSDFMKIGAPLSVMIMVLTVSIVYFVWG